jgi:hypothetical protein
MSDSSIDKHEGIKWKEGAFIATTSVAAKLCENHDAPCYTILSQDVRVFNATMSCMHSTVTNLLQDVDDGMMMRTSPCWIRARHILPHATSHFNSAATFGSDSTNMPARFRRYVPHPASKQGV